MNIFQVTKVEENANKVFWLPVITMRSKESRQCLAVSDTSGQQLAMNPRMARMDIRASLGFIANC